ncbi:MAG: tetratricopeptide repeat protein [Bacteroidota bacterium]
MNNPHSKYITKISNKYGVSEAYMEIILNEDRLKYEIENIKSDRNINLEVLQFIYNSDFYPQLAKKLSNKREELTKVDNHQMRLAIGQSIAIIEEEIKQYKINTLTVSHNITQHKSTERIEKVKSLFFAGQTKEAIATLNEHSLTETQNQLLALSKVEDKLKEAYEKLVNNAYEFLTKGQLTILNLDISGAENRLLKSIEYFDTGVISIERSKKPSYEAEYKFEYGYFLQGQRQNQKALFQYENALKIYRVLDKSSTETFQPHLAQVINNLAILYADKNEFSLSIKFYSEALTFYEKLTDQNPGFYQQFIATISNNMGIIKVAKNEFDEAKAHYEKALVIRRALAESAPDTYLHMVSNTLMNLGNLYKDIQQYIQAKTSYVEALEIIKKLSQKNQQEFLPDVAHLQNNLGQIYRLLGELDTAHTYFETSLLIYSQLADTNPYIYLSYKANTLNNLAGLNATSNNLKESEHYFENALKIRESLYDFNPSTYGVDLGKTLHDLSNLHLINRAYPKAEIKLNQALKIWQELSKVNPEVYSFELGQTLHVLGNLYSGDLHKYLKARKAYIAAIESFEIMASRGIQRYLLEKAKVLVNFGNFLLDRNEIEESKSRYKEALTIFKASSSDSSETFLQYISTIQTNLGLLYHRNNELDESKKAYEDSLITKRALANQHIEAHRPGLALLLNNLGVLCDVLGEHDLARHYLEEALLHRKVLAEKNPEAYSFQLTETLIQMSIFFLVSTDNYVKGLDYLKQTIQHCLRLEKTPQRQQFFEIIAQIAKKRNIDLNDLLNQ